ncbi:hypothetical protein B7463_g7502, partial [Scytalidium lignicola]
MTNFKIDIVSDTVCPWCYIGKKKLDKAISAYQQSHPGSEDTFSISWLPFYLNPGAPKIGVDKGSYFVAKFGEGRTQMIFERLRQQGEETGINFKFGGKTGNTRDSHRLIQLGKTKSPQMETRVVEELFRSYFEEEGDITSPEMLRKAAVKAGLDENEVKEWLKTDKGGEAVDEEVRRAKLEQITGVPNFTLQGKYEVGGAQDPAVFLRLFEKIKDAETAKESKT